MILNSAVLVLKDSEAYQNLKMRAWIDISESADGP